MMTPEAKKEYNRMYYRANKERLAEKAKQNAPNFTSEKRKEYLHQYYMEHRDPHPRVPQDAMLPGLRTTIADKLDMKKRTNKAYYRDHKASLARARNKDSAKAKRAEYNREYYKRTHPKRDTGAVSI